MFKMNNEKLNIIDLAVIDIRFVDKVTEKLGKVSHKNRVNYYQEIIINVINNLFFFLKSILF